MKAFQEGCQVPDQQGNIFHDQLHTLCTPERINMTAKIKLTTDVAQCRRDGCISRWRHMCTWGVAGVWALTPPLSLATAAFRFAKVAGRCFQKLAYTAKNTHQSDFKFSLHRTCVSVITSNWAQHYCRDMPIMYCM